MNDAVIMKAVPSPSPDDTSTAWQGIPFSANTSRPGSLNKPQVMVLIAASVLIHGVIWWYMQTAQPDVPEVAPQVPEMTIELTSRSGSCTVAVNGSLGKRRRSARSA